MDTIQGWLAEGKPVMVCWNDWGGHWQVIIGYDTMGTETQQDDVFIVADPTTPPTTVRTATAC